jgi:uncharacterized protein (TIGR03067 family)
MRPVTAAVVAAGLLVGGAGREQAARRELDRLQGTWAFVSVEANGNKAPADKLKDLRWVIRGDQLFRREGGRTIAEATIRLDPTRKPKTIDLAGKDKEGRSRRGLGIYELDGDRLKIALGKERPAEFRSAPGSGVVLTDCRREPK